MLSVFLHSSNWGNIYIYIYIYIYCHPQTDGFLISQLFSLARHVGRLKLGSKSAQIYVRLSIIPLSHQANHVSSGILRHYVVAFFCLHFLPYRIPEGSIHSKSFGLCEWQSLNHFVKRFGWIHQIVSFLNSSSEDCLGQVGKDVTVDNGKAQQRHWQTQILRYKKYPY